MVSGFGPMLPRVRVLASAGATVVMLAVRGALERVDEQISEWIDRTALYGTSPMPMQAHAWHEAASRRLHEVARIAADLSRGHASEPTIERAAERVFTLIGAIQELLDVIARESQRIAGTGAAAAREVSW